MRKEPTAAEKHLSQSIRANKLGTRVRRQMNIGAYIVDFVLPEYNVIIEVDGLTHAEMSQIEYDNSRSEWLEQQGYRMIRVGNLAVLQNLSGVLERIELAIAETPPNPPAKARGNQKEPR